LADFVHNILAREGTIFQLDIFEFFASW